MQEGGIKVCQAQNLNKLVMNFKISYCKLDRSLLEEIRSVCPCATLNIALGYSYK